MPHENSATVKRLVDGKVRWLNIDTVGSNKGRILGSKNGFATQREAVRAAVKRSNSFNDRFKPILKEGSL